MKSEWKVHTSFIYGKLMYIAYRYKDKYRVLSRGIELYGEYSEDRSAIQAIVDKLNKEDKS